MHISVSTDGTNNRIIISGNLSVATVAEAKLALLPLLAGESELAVDLSAVEKMDCAGLQLLLLLKQAMNSRVQFINHSTPVRNLLRLSHTEHYFGDPLLIPAGQS
jgi:anti-anti-sigma factor